MNRTSLTRFAWLSVAAAVATIGLKFIAYMLTGSVGLLSDALESVVNLIGAMMALVMLTVASRPPDDDHAYGHGKAEYFSSGAEGALIVAAAISIAWAAVDRLLAPRALGEVAVGLGISVVASLINLGVALLLLRAGRQYRSISLEANARHLLTDVWTSVGVVVGVAAVVLTRWQWLDPVVALVVASNIAWSGFSIVRRSVLGLMDTALPPEDQRAVRVILDSYQREGIQYHALRSRQSGSRRFVSFHVLVPGDWTVHRGHQLLDRMETEVREALPQTTVFTHLESLDDPASWRDEQLEPGATVPGSGASH